MGQLHGQGQPAFEAEPANASNSNPRGGAPIAAFHKTWYCEGGWGDLSDEFVVGDLNHTWNAMHLEHHGGRMDRFTWCNSTMYKYARDPDPDRDLPDPWDPNGSRAMGYYDRSDLPFYYALYSTFATSDRFFSSLLGPTQPNRFYLYCATSFGNIQNVGSSTAIFGATGLYGSLTQPTIFGKLTAAGVTWKYYCGSRVGGLLATAANLFKDVPYSHIHPISQFYTDLAKNQLPQVSYIDPAFTSGVTNYTTAAPNAATDEHPCSNIQVGQRYIYQLLNALWKSRSWATSAVFLTYDEAGGYYDHVPPPRAVPPDSIAPNFGKPANPAYVPGRFNQFGFRVPFVVVSPFAKRNFVSHCVVDHTSILQFIEDRFLGGKRLTARDAAAGSLLPYFDFSNPQLKVPGRLRTAPKVAPSVRLAKPTYGATLSGNPGYLSSTNLGAYAVAGWKPGLAGLPSLHRTVKSVKFYLSGVGAIDDGTSPPGYPNTYTTRWNTKNVANGTYTLWAEAEDNAGAIGRSAPISITVKN